MDIGTAKPSAAERAAVLHHLIDIADPAERYSAGRFRSDALAAIAGVFQRDKIPLLVGGTMLYYRVLVSGLDVLPAANQAIRKSIHEKAKARGWPALHAELAEVDPQAAPRIMPNDAQRIQRTLEVFRITGRPMSEFLGKEKKSLEFDLKPFVIFPPDRAELHRQIELRFDRMLKEGLLEEVRSLRRRHNLSADLPSMRCVGYRQAWQFLEGALDQKALREEGIAATRQLAKRQLTWLRALPGAEPAERLAGALTRA